MEYDVQGLINAAMGDIENYDFVEGCEKTASVNEPQDDLACELEKLADKIEDKEIQTQEDESEVIHKQAMEMAKIAILVQVAAEHHGMDKEAVAGLGRLIKGVAKGVGGKTLRGAGRATAKVTGGRMGSGLAQKGMAMTAAGKTLRTSAKGARHLTGQAAKAAGKGKAGRATKLRQMAKSTEGARRAGAAVTKRQGIAASKAAKAPKPTVAKAKGGADAGGKATAGKATPINKAPKASLGKQLKHHIGTKAFKKDPALAGTKVVGGLYAADTAKDVAFGDKPKGLIS